MRGLRVGWFLHLGIMLCTMLVFYSSSQFHFRLYEHQFENALDGKLHFLLITESGTAKLTTDLDMNVIANTHYPRDDAGWRVGIDRFTDRPFSVSIQEHGLSLEYDGELGVRPGKRVMHPWAYVSILFGYLFRERQQE